MGLEDYILFFWGPAIVSGPILVSWSIGPPKNPLKIDWHPFFSQGTFLHFRTGGGYKLYGFLHTTKSWTNQMFPPRCCPCHLSPNKNTTPLMEPEKSDPESLEKSRVIPGTSNNGTPRMVSGTHTIPISLGILTGVVWE